MLVVSMTMASGAAVSGEAARVRSLHVALFEGGRHGRDRGAVRMVRRIVGAPPRPFGGVGVEIDL